mgnify:CR=1 FL=1
MADKKRNTQRKHIRSEGAYSLDEIRSLTMDDGTRVITSADGDIKRPVCAGIDVHKEILMAAVCKTDPKTLNAVFYVRDFPKGSENTQSSRTFDTVMEFWKRFFSEVRI